MANKVKARGSKAYAAKQAALKKVSTKKLRNLRRKVADSIENDSDVIGTAKSLYPPWYEK